MEVKEEFGSAPGEEAGLAKQNVPFPLLFPFCFFSCVRREGRRRLGSPTRTEYVGLGQDMVICKKPTAVV